MTPENYAELARGDFPRAIGNSLFVSLAAVPFLLLQRFYVRTMMHSGGR